MVASSSSSSSSSSPSSSRRSIPPLVLLSFAVLHSQVYWLYSIIYHLCNNLSDRPLDLSLDDTVFQALTRRSGRARAFSEPQQTYCAMLQQQQQQQQQHQHEALNDATISSKITRPRGTTISATTVDADAPLQRQQWVQQFQARVAAEQQQQQQQQQILLDEAIADERSGRTRPPRWWQRTRRHLTRQDKYDESDTTTTTTSNSNITSTLSLPSVDAVIGTNHNHDHHLTFGRPVSPSSCDMQSHYHHDITNPAMRIDQSGHLTHPNLTLPSIQLVESLEKDHSISTTTMESSTATPPMNQQQQQQQQQRQRPLAKIRSVLIKSQIEPENKGHSSSSSSKRKTVLGLPSRWSVSFSNNDDDNDDDGNGLVTGMDTWTKKRPSVRTVEHLPSPPSLDDPLLSNPLRSKRRLFSSLPTWKRKSVG